MTETQLQIQIATWLRQAHPSWLWLHIPNEGKRNPMTGAILRSMGMSKGWPDILIFGHTCHASYLWEYAPGIAMELKSARGKASDAQVNVLAALRARGWLCAVVRSLDDAKKLCGE
jgi:hypothetical protein